MTEITGLAAATAGHDPACDVAHGHAPPPARARTLVAVFASAVTDYLLRYAADVGYQPVLLEPDEELARAARSAGRTVAGTFGACGGSDADVVVTDHHREELGPVLRDVLAGQASWVGVMGSPRHPAPHIPALAALGVASSDIARVHRPIGLNIGSKTPPEIAIATIAGLIAERHGCPGGFSFAAG